jgi:hypothetical protein
MGEHPVSVQPKMIMAFLLGGGYRICLVNHERIQASQADLPGSRQPGRASADHDTLLHDASVYPSPPAVNKNPPGYASRRTARVSQDRKAAEASVLRASPWCIIMQDRQPHVELN